MLSPSVVASCAWLVATPGATRIASLAPYLGSYFRGHSVGFTWSLVIEADGHFEYNSGGGVYDRNEGTVQVERGRLLFRTVSPPSEDTIFPFSATWLPVRWGDRLYLVAENALVRFVNQINLGREPRRTRDGFSVLREGDWEKPADGQPDLPARLLDLLLAEPITGKVISATDKRAQLSVGARQGVFLGMELSARSSTDDRCVLTVVEVWNSQSMADAWCIIGRVQPGTTVASREE